MNSHRTGKVWRVQTFQNYGFLNISPEAELHTIPKGLVNSLITEHVWENIDNSQVFFYLTDIQLEGNNTIPNAWGCAKSHNMEIFCGKPYHSQAVVFMRKLEVIRKPKQTPEHESSRK